MDRASIVVKFDGVDLKRVDVETLSVAECDYVQAELDIMAAHIDSQLVEARAHAAVTGEYSDTSWYTKAILALKYARVQRVAVQTRRARLVKDEKRNRSAAEERNFIVAARQLLDRTTYLEIWGRARQLADEAGASGEVLQSSDNEVSS
jgi:hypothetical protein